MDEIAQEADYGKGTLYNYFKSKDDLLWCMINRTLENFGDSITAETENSKSCKEKIHVVIEKSISLLDKDPTIFELWEYIEGKQIDPKADKKSEERFSGILNFLRVFADMFNEGMKSGEIRRNNPMMLTIILFGVIRSVYKTGKSGINTNSPKQNMEFISDLLFRKL
jgi:TetR/AcrR family fatty acid metabolism transcriptional regulator